MTSEAKTAAGKRVLVVEDEMMIRMLLEGMLADLGHTVAGRSRPHRRGDDAGQTGRIRHRHARRQSQRPADYAGGRNSGRARPAVRLRQRLWPARRAGSLSRPSRRCRSRSRSKRWREALEAATCRKPATRLKLFVEQLGEPRHRRLVGDVDLERRHRDAAVVERRDVGAVLGLDVMLARIGDPVIGIAAAVDALVDMQPLLPAPARAASPRCP